MRPFETYRMGRQAGGGDIQVMTTGSNVIGDTTYRGYDDGLVSGGAMGSLTDGTSNLYGGATIRVLLWTGFDDGVDQAEIFQFRVSGLFANSGWTQVTSSHGETYLRTSATYSQAGGVTTWNWDVTGSGTTPASNPCTGNPTFTWS